MLTLKISSFLLAVGQLCKAQDYYDYVSECPEENGFFADAVQCDRYYECKDGEVIDHLCPDGLVFDESSTAFAKCSFPFSIDCTGRSELQEAQASSPFCPRANGYFADPDLSICDVFHFCVDRIPNKVTCPSGLIFDPAKGQCGWSDQTNRKGCRSVDLFDFKCPNLEGSRADHSRHPDPENCAEFYLCIDGKARKSGCGPGLVFSPTTTACERQDTVEGPCSTWFNETYLESVLPPLRPKPSSSINRDVPERRRRPQAPTFERRPNPAPVRSQVQEVEDPFEDLPPQLADLAQNSGLGFFDQPRGSSQNSIRDEIPKSVSRPSISNNIRGGRPRVENRKPQTTPRSAFTRPPRRQLPSRGQSADTSAFEPATSAREPGTGFGRRRTQSRVPPRVAATQDDSFSRVSAQDTRLDLNNLDSLGPAELESFLRQGQGDQPQQQDFQTDFTSPREVPSAPSVASPSSFSSGGSQSSFSSSETSADFEPRRRVPLSRGSIPRRQPTSQEQEPADIPQAPSRGSPFRRGQIRRGGGGRRGSPVRGSPEVEQEVEDVEDTVSSGSFRRTSAGSRRTAAGGSGRGRLEVTQLSGLPPLRQFEEDENEFSNFSSIRQRSRGRQSRKIEN